MSENELAKLPDELQALFQKDESTEDFENVADQDRVRKRPLLLLMQGLSGYVVDGTAKMGQLVANKTGKVVLEDPKIPLNVIPLFYWRSRQYFNDDNALQCRSIDCQLGTGDPGGFCEACTLKDWKENSDGPDTPPDCDLTHNWIVLLPAFDGDDRVQQLSVSKTLFPFGRTWLRYQQGLEGRLFTRQYQISTFIDTTRKKPHAMMSMPEWDGTNRKDKKVTDVELLKECLELHRVAREDHARAVAAVRDRSGIKSIGEPEKKSQGDMDVPF